MSDTEVRFTIAPGILSNLNVTSEAALVQMLAWMVAQKEQSLDEP